MHKITTRSSQDEAEFLVEQIGLPLAKELVRAEIAYWTTQGECVTIAFWNAVQSALRKRWKQFIKGGREVVRRERALRGIEICKTMLTELSDET